MMLFDLLTITPCRSFSVTMSIEISDEVSPNGLAALGLLLFVCEVTLFLVGLEVRIDRFWANLVVGRTSSR